jgi:leader peptidase (prepilin peptidase)/N-methyltransferase
LTVLLIIALGLIIGSFLSVCIYRIPLGRFDDVDNSDIIDEVEIPPYERQVFEGNPVSFSFPRRSISPCCKKQLRWWHNIPLVSWLCLGGRCAFCKQGIPMRYPLVELLSASCAFLSVTTYDYTPTALLVYLFSCALIVITFIDYDYFIIPNLITYPGTIVGICVAAINQWHPSFNMPVVEDLWMSFFGILAGGGFLFLVSEVYLRVRKIDGLGMGDVKLLTMTGALFGPECALFTIFMGSLIGSIGGLLLIGIKGRTMSQHLPFGPSLALGTMLYLFFGRAIGEALKLPLQVTLSF